MTRPCGCGGNAVNDCNCVIVPGDPNTGVSGTGIPEDPYVITSGVTAFTATDTDTVDFTLTGDGSGTAYELSAQVRRETSSGNLLTAGPGGLAVACTAVQDCVGEAAGPGLEWSATDRQLRARLSDEPGQILSIADDGGLYATADGTVTPTQPRARIGKANPQLIQPSINTITRVDFDSPITDSAGLYSAIGQLAAPIPGGYHTGVTIQWANQGQNVGHRAVFLRLNGVQFIAADQRDAAAQFSTIQNISTDIDLAAGDYIEVLVQHAHSIAINILASPLFVPTFWLYYVTEGA